jgi:hypothetical protein
LHQKPIEGTHQSETEYEKERTTYQPRAKEISWGRDHGPEEDEVKSRRKHSQRIPEQVEEQQRTSQLLDDVHLSTHLDCCLLRQSAQRERERAQEVKHLNKGKQT